MAAIKSAPVLPGSQPSGITVPGTSGSLTGDDSSGNDKGCESSMDKKDYHRPMTNVTDPYIYDPLPPPKKAMNITDDDSSGDDRDGKSSTDKDKKKGYHRPMMNVTDPYIYDPLPPPQKAEKMDDESLSEESEEEDEDDWSDEDHSWSEDSDGEYRCSEDSEDSDEDEGWFCGFDNKRRIYEDYYNCSSRNLEGDAITTLSRWPTRMELRKRPPPPATKSEQTSSSQPLSKQRREPSGGKSTLKRPLSDENEAPHRKKPVVGGSGRTAHNPSPPSSKPAKTIWRTFAADCNRKPPGERIIDEVELLSRHPPSPSWNWDRLSGGKKRSGNRLLGLARKGDKERSERSAADIWSDFSCDPAPPAIRQGATPFVRAEAVSDQLSKLHRRLEDILTTPLTGRKFKGGANGPVPKFWVNKWVDYTEEYGVAYQLCSDGVGMLFNDGTHITVLDDGKTVKYLDWRQQEHSHTLAKKPPPYLKTKVELMEHFSEYMMKHLRRTGGSGGRRTAEERAHPPHLVSWFRTHSAVTFHFSDGTVQVNFLQDHSKIILCPLMDTVSYIDRKREFCVYQMDSLLNVDLAMDLVSRLRHSRDVVKKLIAQTEPRAALANMPGTFRASTPKFVRRR